MNVNPQPKKHRHSHGTRPGVRLADTTAKTLITLGGIGTIVAVCGVLVFLLWVVMPLFGGASIDSQASNSTGPKDILPAYLAMDDPQQLGLYLTSAGQAGLFRLAANAPALSQSLASAPVASTSPATAPGPTPTITAAAACGQNDAVAVGYQNGAIRLGRVTVVSQLLGPDAPDASPLEARNLPVGQSIAADAALWDRLTDEKWQRRTLKVEMDDPLETGSDQPVVLLDYLQQSSGHLVAALTADGQVVVESVRQQRNMMTGKTTQRVTRANLPTHAHVQGKPIFLGVFGLGDGLVLAWEDGSLLRYDIRDLQKPALVETVDLLADPQARLTALHFVLGRNSLVAGDSKGQLSVWFRTKPPQATTSDGATFVLTRTLPGRTHAVTAIASSYRRRLVAVGYADGHLDLIHVTSGKVLASLDVGADQPVTALAMAPKDDGILALSASGWRQWRIDVGYPEVTFNSIFSPVWYEGYNQPVHVWQSSAATDDFEPKLGLIPLVFGSLKATLYAMLIATPLALLAAIYTSEFLHPRVKARVKPTIELMASLPSVVLGFLAGLVIAPFVENVIPSVLLGLFTVPLVFLAGAIVWHLLPYRLTLRLDSQRLWFLLLLLPLGLVSAYLLGPWMELWLFAGDLHHWLDGQIGSPAGGWVLLLMPLTALLTVMLVTRWIDPWLREHSSAWTRARAARVNALRFVCGCCLTVLLALSGAYLLTLLGWDPRGPWTLAGIDLAPMQTYVQRNALIVGFAMGFAVIPIIYTIADDALSAVPDHLRSASLGAGATPWQTAVRVIIPTAMSGLFSAVMVGLGRAVGETMIVLMAAGNTPVLKANIFEGFRTLSANIATEMPEAVRNSTHYRTLFMTALVLFILTFIINTLAEAVRLRFRKRAFQL